MTTIAQNMSQIGYAPVIAVLHRDRKSDGPSLRTNFTAEAGSPLGGNSLVAARRAGESIDAPSRVRIYPNLGIVYGTVDPDGLAALKADPAVRTVTAANPFSLIRPVAAADSTLIGKQTWGLSAMHIPEMWEQGLTGAGVKVAHLDTGIDGTHQALKDAIGQFAQFDLTGRVIPGAPVVDSDERDGHGTHTAATIAGREVQGRHVGVAPGAELYSAMVIEGGDVVARILGGMDWAVGQGVKILSMSLGIRGLVADFLEIVDVLRDNSVLPVIAVGNEGPGTSRSPGNYPKALSVGAFDSDGRVADFSSSQRFKRRSQPLAPDLVAPGVDVVSARPGGGWRSLSGSSMATPHVAGLAALLLEAKPALTVSKLERAIFSSARLGSMDVERANRGAVDGLRALAAI
jgi:subtilisin family serine protease